MARVSFIACCRIACVTGRRKRLWHGVVALALTVPHAAQPCSLKLLIDVPLEHLLQLEISPRRVSACDGSRGPPDSACSSPDGERHAA